MFRLYLKTFKLRLKPSQASKVPSPWPRLEFISPVRASLFSTQHSHDLAGGPLKANRPDQSRGPHKRSVRRSGYLDRAGGGSGGQIDSLACFPGNISDITHPTLTHSTLTLPHSHPTPPHPNPMPPDPIPSQCTTPNPPRPYLTLQPSTLRRRGVLGRSRTSLVVKGHYPSIRTSPAGCWRDRSLTFRSLPLRMHLMRLCKLQPSLSPAIRSMYAL